MATAINMDRIVQAYNAIRDARTVKRHAWEAEDTALEADQDKLKVVMLQHLQTHGATSIATDHGTAYRTEKIKPSAADWTAIWDWMRENDGIDLLERRIKATFVKQYMDDNGGALPPGVNVHREYEVAVRRKGSRGGTDDGE